MIDIARQDKALKFIRGYIQSNEQAPSIKEIGDYLGYRSSSDVHSLLVALENRGLIIRTPNISRGIEVVK